MVSDGRERLRGDRAPRDRCHRGRSDHRSIDCELTDENGDGPGNRPRDGCRARARVHHENQNRKPAASCIDVPALVAPHVSSARIYVSASRRAALVLRDLLIHPSSHASVLCELIDFVRRCTPPARVHQRGIHPVGELSGVIQWCLHRVSMGAHAGTPIKSVQGWIASPEFRGRVADLRPYVLTDLEVAGGDRSSRGRDRIPKSP